MKTRRLIGSLIFSIFIIGCNAPAAAPATEAGATADAPAAATATFPSPAANATSIGIPLAPPATLIVAATIPVVVPILTGPGPVASPNSGPLNCRGGPDLRWPVGDVIDPGENVQIVGRNTDSTWWQVKDPVAFGGICWISAAYATVTGNVGALPIVVVTGVPNINGTPIGRIYRVKMELVPDVIDDPGCVGPAPQITLSALVFVDGPMDFRFHFEGEGIAATPEHHWGFDGPDIAGAVEHFTPPLEAGKHKVYMVADDIDFQGTGAVATYTINC